MLFPVGDSENSPGFQPGVSKTDKDSPVGPAQRLCKLRGPLCRPYGAGSLSFHHPGLKPGAIFRIPYGEKRKLDEVKPMAGPYTVKSNLNLDLDLNLALRTFCKIKIKIEIEKMRPKKILLCRCRHNRIIGCGAMTPHSKPPHARCEGI